MKSLLPSVVGRVESSCGQLIKKKNEISTIYLFVGDGLSVGDSLQNELNHSVGGEVSRLQGTVGPKYADRSPPACASVSSSHPCRKLAHKVWRRCTSAQLNQGIRSSSQSSPPRAALCIPFDASGPPGARWAQSSAVSAARMYAGTISRSRASPARIANDSDRLRPH